MNPLQLIETYYPVGSLAHRALLDHSRLVAAKAVAVATRVAATTTVDIGFVEEAALLHDIGICFTDSPDLGCHGTLPYLAHNYKGRELLECLGYPHHALICERHIGIGISAEEVRRQGLPLPERDMLPISLEEQIVTYADLFFSKGPSSLTGEKSPEEVRRTLARFGLEKIAVFDAWHARFGG